MCLDCCVFAFLVKAIFCSIAFRSTRRNFLCVIFFNLHAYVVLIFFNYEHYGQTTSLFILLSFYLLTDNDSEYNNLQNNKHNNITEDGSVKIMIEVLSFFIFPFIYA